MCMYIHMYLHTHAHISLYAHTYTSMQTVASGQWWSIGSAGGPAGTTGTALSWWSHGNNTHDWQAQLHAAARVRCGGKQHAHSDAE